MSEFAMPDPAIGRESYMHRAAKEVVTRWLREAAAAAGPNDYACLSPVTWRVNRDGPTWGVWEEYPLLETGCWPAWDEVNEAFAYAPPKPEWCFENGHRVVCVADVAVQHKGIIKAVVEIVHKHPCGDNKRAFYREHGIDLVEVPARWVLEQTKRPAALLTLADLSVRQMWRYAA